MKYGIFIKNEYICSYRVDDDGWMPGAGMSLEEFNRPNRWGSSPYHSGYLGLIDRPLDGVMLIQPREPIELWARETLRYMGFDISQIKVEGVVEKDIFLGYVGPSTDPRSRSEILERGGGRFLLEYAGYVPGRPGGGGVYALAGNA